MQYSPSPKREDLRYGDPHGRRGRHLFYGPDCYALQEKKRPLESHGFYLPEEGAPRPGLWQQLKGLIHRH